MALQGEKVYVRSFDGAYINAVLRSPDETGPYPAVMLIHGGLGGDSQEPGPVGHVQAHLLADGYVVFDVDFRRYHYGDEELEDVVACYRYLRSRPEVDRDRVGVIGGSQGGYLALMLATRERPAAVVAFAGLVDVVAVFYKQVQEALPEVQGNFEQRERLFHQDKSIREESELIDKGLLSPDAHEREVGIGWEVSRDLAFRWGEDIEVFKRYSPKEQYHHIESPLLYVVGDEDNFRTAGEGLVNNLRALGRAAEYSEHPGMGHGFYWGHKRDANGDIPEEFYRSLKRTTDFLRKWVKG